MHYQSPILLGLFAGMIQISAQSNLLNNADMESWSGSTPSQWMKESGCATEQENGLVMDGNFSVRLMKTGASNRGLYQDINIRPGDICSFRVWVQNTDINATIRLTISWYQGTFYLSQYAQSAASAGIGAWQVLAIQEAAAPENATFARCRIRVYGDQDLACLADQATFSVETSLSVMLLDFSMEHFNGMHRLRWRTASEINTAGYFLYRALSPEGPFECLTPVLIPGRGNHSEETCYQVEYPWSGNESVWYRLDEITMSGSVNILDLIQASPPGPPLENAPGPLKNFPNPFNPDTHIEFTITEETAGWVKLRLWNLTGQPVITLIDEMLNPGTYTVYWHGLDSQWRDTASGIYLCGLWSSGRLIHMREMIKVE